MADNNYLESAIKDWRFLLRTFILILGIAAILFGLTYSVIKFCFPYIDTIENNGNGFTLHLRGKILTVVNVPACQFGTVTGIKLDKKLKISVKTSGLVSTAADPAKINVHDETEKNILELRMDRDLHLGWRDPDGERLTGEDSKTGKNELLLKQDANYGCLLAFAVPISEGVDVTKEIIEKLSKRNENQDVIKIGKKCDIVFDKDKQQYIATIEGEKYQPFTDAKDGEELCFVINDSVVNDKSDIENNFKNGKDKYSKIQKEIEIHEYLDLNEPRYFWYLDNRGSFTATILQEKE